MNRHKAKAPPAGDGDVGFLIQQAGNCRTAGDLAGAESLLRQAVALAPGSVPAATNHGLLLSEIGRHVESVQVLRRAVEMAPTFAPAWNNLALALRQGGDHAAADAAQAEAARLAPDSPEARVAAGLAAQAAGQIHQALAAYREALRLDAGMPETWINLGLALHALGDSAGCRAALEQALALRPADRRALSNLLMTSQYDPSLSLADLQRTAQRAAAGWPSQGTRPPPRARAGQRLRLAYLSGDLYAHPVGWLLAPVLRAHDRSAVEVHVFDHRSQHGTPDPVSQRLRDATEHWHEVGAMDDLQIAQQVRQAGIDVLVDLSGHTSDARLGVLAQQPAPVQLSWLGYFGSTGLPAVDAVVLGSTLAPVGAEAAYTEPIERVAGLHFGWDPPEWAPLPAAAPSAARGQVTFGSFNNTAKLGDGVVAAWALALHAVPGSRLVLKWKSLADASLVARLQRRFASHGVDPQRLEFRPASPHAQMLAEYGDVDVALDPFPFSGLVTTLEALWMGVPLVTMPQQRSVSRQSAAILDAIGARAWVAHTPRDFARVAAALAADLPMRQALRAPGPDSLRSRIAGSALMDAAPLARAIEAIAKRRLQARLAGTVASAAPPQAQHTA